MKWIYALLAALCIGIGVYVMNNQAPYTGNIVLVGPPGSGKGTLATKLSEHTGLPILTVSTVLKQAMQKDEVLAKEAKALMDQGKFVSDDIIERILAQELRDVRYQNGVIFDGFPRTLAQTAFFRNNQIEVDMVIILEADDDLIVERMAGRRVHLPSGRMYHIVNNPPKVEGLDDVSGEALSQRPDDDPEIVRRRLADYHALTKPVIEWAKSELEPEGVVKKVLFVDATQPIDVVWSTVKESLQNI